MLRRRAMMRRPIARLGAAAVGTAVVVGTAGVVHHAQQKRYSQQDGAAQQQYDQAYQQGVTDAQAQQQNYPPPEIEASAQPESELTTRIKELAQLHDSGILTDEEFAAAKQKLLGG
jgi:uncharacterized protein HemX